VERLFNAGFCACAPLGRVPIGATPELVGAFPWRGGDPPGDEVDVLLDC